MPAAVQLKPVDVEDVVDDLTGAERSNFGSDDLGTAIASTLALKVIPELGPAPGEEVRIVKLYFGSSSTLLAIAIVFASLAPVGLLSGIFEDDTGGTEGAG